MSKRKLQILARYLIGKCLGLTVAAKNIDIVSYEDGGLFPLYLVFTILGKNNINYVLREQLCGIWKFYINNMAITELRLKDFEEGGQTMSGELFEIFLDMLEEACYDYTQED